MSPEEFNVFRDLIHGPLIHSHQHQQQDLFLRNVLSSGTPDIDFMFKISNIVKLLKTSRSLEFIFYDRRLETFPDADLSDHGRNYAQIVACNGFILTQTEEGISDESYLQCFSCGLELPHDTADEILNLHAIKSPECFMVTLKITTAGQKEEDVMKAKTAFRLLERILEDKDTLVDSVCEAGGLDKTIVRLAVIRCNNLENLSATDVSEKIHSDFPQDVVLCKITELVDPLELIKLFFQVCQEAREVDDEVENFHLASRARRIDDRSGENNTSKSIIGELFSSASNGCSHKQNRSQPVFAFALFPCEDLITCLQCMLTICVGFDENQLVKKFSNPPICHVDLSGVACPKCGLHVAKLLSCFPGDARRM